MPLYQRTRVNKRVRRLELPLRWRRWRRRWWRLVLHHDDWLLRQLLLQLLPFGSAGGEQYETRARSAAPAGARREMRQNPGRAAANIDALD